MLFKNKILLSFVALLVLVVMCVFLFAIYRTKVIHIGNIYWVDCGASSNGTRMSKIIHDRRILLKADIEVMGYYPFLYVAYFPMDNPFAEKEGRYVKIDVRSGTMQIADGNEIAHFSNKYHLHFKNHRQVLVSGNEYWQDHK